MSLLPAKVPKAKGGFTPEGTEDKPGLTAFARGFALDEPAGLSP
jgi:hypothetical protein